MDRRMINAGIFEDTSRLCDKHPRLKEAILYSKDMQQLYKEAAEEDLRESVSSGESEETSRSTGSSMDYDALMAALYGNSSDKAEESEDEAEVDAGSEKGEADTCAGQEGSQVEADVFKDLEEGRVKAGSCTGQLKGEPFDAEQDFVSGKGNGAKDSLKAEGAAHPYEQPARVLVSMRRSLEAAAPYAREGKKTCVLNFASATNPGGGVLRGSSAQEESICRCSTLYFALNTDNLRKDFYQPHRAAGDPLYNDDAIYTPGVLVFKTDDDSPKTMPEADWYGVDVLTMAAPNLRENPSDYMNPDAGTKGVLLSNRELAALLEKRIRRMFEVAKEQGAEVLILGAFGCGAFQNPPAVVSKVFAKVMRDYLYDFEAIEYAIYCRPDERLNHQIFAETMQKFITDDAKPDSRTAQAEGADHKTVDDLSRILKEDIWNLSGKRPGTGTDSVSAVVSDLADSLDHSLAGWFDELEAKAGIANQRAQMSKSKAAGDAFSGNGQPAAEGRKVYDPANGYLARKAAAENMQAGGAVKSSQEQTDGAGDKGNGTAVTSIDPRKAVASTIDICKVSITDTGAECVVNAANEGLWAGGGVCGAIFRAAGYEDLEKVCSKIGHCDTGDCAITPGFALSTYIIHAVGPVYRGGTSGEAKLLYSCYRRTLEKASAFGIHSIAFPLISAGIFGYPVSEAWDLALEACRDFITNHPLYEIHITFAVLDDEILQMGLKKLRDGDENA